MKKLFYILLIPLSIFAQVTYQKSKFDQVWYDAAKEKSHSTFALFDTSSIKLYYTATGKPLFDIYDQTGSRIFHLDSLGVTHVSGGVRADTFGTPHYKFPHADGTSNQVMTTNGSGVISWTSVTSETIKDGQVKTVDLATNAVDSTKILNDAVTSETIKDGQVKTADLAASSVSMQKLTSKYNIILDSIFDELSLPDAACINNGKDSLDAADFLSTFDGWATPYKIESSDTFQIVKTWLMVESAPCLVRISVCDIDNINNVITYVDKKITSTAKRQYNIVFDTPIHQGMLEGDEQFFFAIQSLSPIRMTRVSFDTVGSDQYQGVLPKYSTLGTSGWADASDNRFSHLAVFYDSDDMVNFAVNDSTKIKNDAVTSETIKDGQVKTADLAANAVDSTKIKNDAVTSETIQDGQVKTADLAANVGKFIQAMFSDTTKHRITFAAISDTIFSSPYGLSEHDPASSYQQRGVGMVWRAPFGCYFKKIKADFFAHSKSTVRVKIYKANFGGDSYSSYNLTTLTFCDSIDFSYNTFPRISGLNEIVLNNPLYLDKDEYLFILVGGTVNDADNYVSIGRHTSDPLGSRLNLLFNTSPLPFTAGTWSRASDSYQAPPPILFIDDLTYAQKDSLSDLQHIDVLQKLTDIGGKLAYDGSVVDTDTDTDVDPDSVKLMLPDTVFCSAESESNIYFENVTQVTDYHDFVFDVSCDSGRTEAIRWTWTPAGTTSGDYQLILTARNSDNDIIEIDTTIIHVTNKLTTSSSRNILIIGDSITDVNHYPAYLKDLAGDSLVFIGTQDTETDSPNEGYGGKSYTWVESDTASPFIFSTGGHVDFPQYLSHYGLDAPDMIYIHLGTNDLVGYTLKSDADVEAVLVKCDSIVNAAIRDIPGVKIGIGMTIPPSYSQDAWGANYNNSGCRWFHKLNMQLLSKHLMARYGKNGTKKHAQVSLHPVYTCIDTEHNMYYSSTAYNSRTTWTYNKQTNGVHPSAEGYWQMADSIWGWVRSNW